MYTNTDEDEGGTYFNEFQSHNQQQKQRRKFSNADEQNKVVQRD